MLGNKLGIRFVRSPLNQNGIVISVVAVRLLVSGLSTPTGRPSVYTVTAHSSQTSLIHIFMVGQTLHVQSDIIWSAVIAKALEFKLCMAIFPSENNVQMRASCNSASPSNFVPFSSLVKELADRASARALARKSIHISKIGSQNSLHHSTKHKTEKRKKMASEVILPK